MNSVKQTIFAFVIAFLNVSISFATERLPDSPEKPKLEELLKEKSIKQVVEDKRVVTNTEFTKDSDFAFIDAVLINTSLQYARPKIMDFSKYEPKEISSAIKKFVYDPNEKVIEIEGAAGGLKMRSWVKVNEKYWDEVHYEVIRGDMKGFKVKTFFWNQKGKALLVAQGLWPKAQKILPSAVSFLLKPVSEVVIGVATNNFKSYIEREYEKDKRS